MDNTYIKTVLDFLHAHPTLESVNEVILEAENMAKKSIDEVKKYAENFGVYVAIHENQTIQRYIAEETGIQYLEPGYSHEFKAHIARCNDWHSLFYAVRQTVWDYYSYINCEIKGDKVKMTAIHLFGYDEDKEKYTVREYGNGKTVYWYIDEMAERIGLVKEIEEFFQERLHS